MNAIPWLFLRPTHIGAVATVVLVSRGRLRFCARQHKEASGAVDGLAVKPDGARAWRLADAASTGGAHDGAPPAAERGACLRGETAKRSPVISAAARAQRSRREYANPARGM